MGPQKSLDGAALRANVAAFAALGAPVAAVVKRDGYGWGARAIVHEIDGVVESYVVNDFDELAALRPATSRAVRLLADVPSGALEATLALDGIPNVSTADALAEAHHAARLRGGLVVRVGVCDAVGWNAIAPRDIAAFSRACAGGDLQIEAWTHVTAPERADAARANLAALCAALAENGVAVVDRDIASSGSAATGDPLGRARIGVGMFGAALGNGLPLRCALRVRGPVVRVYAPGEGIWAGYGHVSIAPDVAVAVVRCGYGDGLPRTLVGSADILAMGMQYLTRVVRVGDPGDVMNADTDLDVMATFAGITAHELVVGLA